MFARMASILAILAQTHDREIYRDFVATVFRIPTLSPTARERDRHLHLTDTLGHTSPPARRSRSAASRSHDRRPHRRRRREHRDRDRRRRHRRRRRVSGLSGPVTVEDLLDYVDQRHLVGITTGGTDGETVDEYVDRVHDELPTLSFAVVTPRDAELIAMSVPGVDLAMAIDRYVPAGPGGTPAAQTDVDGAITVAVRDAAGQASAA
jgi:hypothetical protein